MMDPHELRRRLPNTWAAFFARHGSFTAVQQQAIPPVLEGSNTLVVAATASGKTEAVVAPLLERHLLGKARDGTLAILYICPTRALVRDLYERLALPLDLLDVSLTMKSGDTGPVSINHPPAMLLTTPESTDSLLTRAPRLFATLHALVLDEIHLFDSSPRGDHLRCLLRRIDRIRAYHATQLAATSPESPAPPPLQRVGLSATVSDPAGVARRYLGDDALLVEVAGGRPIEADLYPMYGLSDLAAALGQRAVPKVLLFCNTRNEVEQVAAYLRERLPYEAAIFVHYSNLDPAMRREVEQRFAEATVAICVSSSTLELGIDVGSIDEVALIGAPPTLSSFLQRIGRGGRRGPTARVLCLARSEAEALRFQALLDMAEGGGWPVPDKAYHFLPSVLVQQCFSMLKQSPTGAIRLADLRHVAPEEVPDAVLPHLLQHLAWTGYLRGGRPGEWRAGSELDPLLDEHDIFSNIGGARLSATVVDAYSGRRIAQSERPRRKGESLLLGGKPVEVAWQDRYTFGIQQGQRDEVEEALRFHTAPFAVPLEVMQGIAAHLGVAPGQMPLVPHEEGSWLFHFLGDLYGELFAAILQHHFPAGDEEPFIEPLNEACLALSFSLHALPPWEETVVQREAHRLIPRLEAHLELGRFHKLLPPDLAAQTILQQCDLPRLERLYHAAILFIPGERLRSSLLSLL